jgi:hypothetical protein
MVQNGDKPVKTWVSQKRNEPTIYKSEELLEKLRLPGNFSIAAQVAVRLMKGLNHIKVPELAINVLGNIEEKWNTIQGFVYFQCL